MQYNQPFDQPSNPNASYINGNPAAGIQGSIIPAAAIEFPQRELLAAIQAAGLTPTNSDLAQLLETFKIVDVFNHFKVATNGGNASQWSAAIPALPISPVPLGTAVWFKPGYDSVKGGTVFSVNGEAFQNVVHLDGSPIDIGDIVPSAWCLLFRDASNWQLLVGGTSRGGQLPLLTRNMTWYVNGTTGDDVNYDGTQPIHSTVTPTVGPFRTIQRASDEVLKYNMNNYNQQILIAAGSYVGPVYTRPPNGTGIISINGDTTNPSAVSVVTPGGGVNCCFFQTGGRYNYDSMRLSTNAGDLDCVAVNFGVAVVTNLQYGNAARFHLCSASSGATMYVAHPGYGPGHVIESGASAQSHINASINGFMSFPAPFPAQWPVLTFNGPCNFSGGFISALELCLAQMHYTSITNASYANGSKYYAYGNGVLDSFGGGVNYFPGNSAGSVNTGGLYF